MYIYTYIYIYIYIYIYLYIYISIYGSYTKDAGCQPGRAIQKATTGLLEKFTSELSIGPFSRHVGGKLLFLQGYLAHERVPLRPYSWRMLRALRWS